MMQERDIAGDLAAMRAEFERAFAEPQRAEREEPESLVAVRIAGAPYAFRIKELTGIAVGRRVVKLPSDVPAMVGLARTTLTASFLSLVSATLLLLPSPA